MTAEQTRLWEIVYSDIRGRIERGELMPGEQIPAEHELAEQHPDAYVVTRIHTEHDEPWDVA